MARYQVFPPAGVNMVDGNNFTNNDYEDARRATDWRVEDSTDSRKVWYFDTEDQARAKAAELNRDG